MTCLEAGCNQPALPREAYCEKHRYEGVPGTGYAGPGGVVGASDPPIIISGGSVTIEFEATQLTRVGSDKYSNPNKKIKRVEITGDGINFTTDVPTGSVTVTIYLRSSGDSLVAVGTRDAPIVISGGSVTLKFKDAIFPPLARGHHSNPEKSIGRVEITGDGINFTTDVPATGRARIRVYYGDP